MQFICYKKAHDQYKKMKMNTKKFECPQIDGETMGVQHLFTWQEILLEKLYGNVDPRKIYWVKDLKGGRGKSVFFRYLCYLFQEEIFYFSGGKTNDLLYAYEG